MLKRTSPDCQMIRIRPYQPDDLTDVARILALGWRQAYGGFVPEDMLQKRADPAHREGELRDWLSSEFDQREECLLVADLGEAVAGFILARIGDPNGVGAASQIPLLYVDREVQGRGIGKRLIRAAVAWLKKHAPGPISISAFELNPFRGFYTAIGGREFKRITVKVDDTEWPVVLYLWPSLEALEDQLGIAQPV